MVAMPRPVEVLSGETKKRPSDWRAPIVTMRIAAAASTTAKALRSVFMTARLLCPLYL